MATNLAHIAERKAFGMALNSLIDKGRKGDFAEEALSLIDKIEKILGSSWKNSSYEMLRNIAHSPNSKWAHYVNRLVKETDPHILKTFLLNAGYEGDFGVTKLLWKWRKNTAATFHG